MIGHGGWVPIYLWYKYIWIYLIYIYRYINIYICVESRYCHPLWETFWSNSCWWSLRTVSCWSLRMNPELFLRHWPRILLFSWLFLHSSNHHHHHHDRPGSKSINSSQPLSSTIHSYWPSLTRCPIRMHNFEWLVLISNPHWDRCQPPWTAENHH